MTTPDTQRLVDHDIPFLSSFFSACAEWYLDYFQSVAVVVGVAVFAYKWWTTGTNARFDSIIETTVSAMLIPPGLAFLLTALDPVDLLPRLHEAHLALVVAGCTLIYLGITGARK